MVLTHVSDFIQAIGNLHLSNVSLIISRINESLVSETWLKPKRFSHILKTSETNFIWRSYVEVIWEFKFNAKKTLILMWGAVGPP